MQNVNIFARVAEVRLTSGPFEYETFLEEGWVELGVMLIPPGMSSVIPELKRSALGYYVAVGRVGGNLRIPATEETFQEPRPSEINAKLREGWTLVGIGTETTRAFAKHEGRNFASFFVVQR